MFKPVPFVDNLLYLQVPSNQPSNVPSNTVSGGNRTRLDPASPEKNGKKPAISPKPSPSILRRNRPSQNQVLKESTPSEDAETRVAPVSPVTLEPNIPQPVSIATSGLQVKGDGDGCQVTSTGDTHVGNLATGDVDTLPGAEDVPIGGPAVVMVTRRNVQDGFDSNEINPPVTKEDNPVTNEDNPLDTTPDNVEGDGEVAGGDDTVTMAKLISNVTVGETESHAERTVTESTG